MRRVTPQPDWPELWREAYEFDSVEIWPQPGSDRAYVALYAERTRHALDLVRAAAPPGARVLDVAAAQGNLSLRLAELGYAVTWNDLREGLAPYVALKHEAGKIAYMPGNVFDLRPPEPFDVVLATEIIEHVAHPDELLQSISRLVRPGGHVVLTTPNGGYLRNPLPKFSDYLDPSRFEAVQFKPDADGHIFLLHRDELDALAARAGLAVREQRLFSNFLTVGYLRTRALRERLTEPLVRRIEAVTGRLPIPLQSRIMTHIAALLAKPE